MPDAMMDVRGNHSLGMRRWRIGFLLALGVLVNYIDRINLSVSHDALVGTFHFTDVTFGWLLSGYNFTYALCQMPMGLLLDKFGVRRIGRVGAATVSAASLLTAVAQNVPGLFFARFLLGIGESPIFPGNSKAVGRWFPRRERSFATSLFDASAKFAAAIGVPLVGMLLLRVGWRWCFAATGFLTLVYVAIFWVVYREPEEDAKLTSEELAHIHADQTTDEDLRLASIGMSFGELLQQPKVLGLSIGSMAYNYTFYLLFTWLPIYLARTMHIDLLHSFLYTGVPWLIATVVDIIAGGWLVDWLIAKGLRGGTVRLSFLAGGMAFGLGIFGATRVHSSGWALFWITLSLSGLSAAAPVIWSTPSMIAARENVATVASIANFAGQIGGISAPIVTGYFFARGNYSAAFVVAAGLMVFGIAAYLTLLRRVEPMELRRA